MSYDINIPNITASTEAGKIEQIRSYLFQLADQLKFALNAIEKSSTASLQIVNSNSNSAVESEEKTQATFNSVKALIIKSADILNAYYEEFNQRFSGEYVAQSDFGTYTEQTSQAINNNSTEIEQLFTNLQQIVTDIDNLEHTLIEVNANINSGLLYYDDNGVPIYGLEIGQKNTIDGKEVFNKYARFIGDRLSFYDKNDMEVAYISDYKLYIRDVEIEGSFQEGGYKDYVDAKGGIVTKWVGRN